MFQDQGGSLNKAYQKGLKRKNGDFKSNFWQTVTKKLNEAVEANYTQEVMICRIKMKGNALMNRAVPSCSAIL